MTSEVLKKTGTNDLAETAMYYADSYEGIELVRLQSLGDNVRTESHFISWHELALELARRVMKEKP